jgi:hypothetical protein
MAKTSSQIGKDYPQYMANNSQQSGTGMAVLALFNTNIKRFFYINIKELMAQFYANYTLIK